MYANAWAKFHRKGLLSQQGGDSPQHEGEIDNLTVQCLWWHSTIFKQQCFRFSSFAWNEKELQSFPPKVQGRPRKNKNEAAESDLILKRKAKDEEIQKVKQNISGIESCIKSLHLCKHFVFKNFGIFFNVSVYICSNYCITWIRSIVFHWLLLFIVVAKCISLIHRIFQLFSTRDFLLYVLFYSCLYIFTCSFTFSYTYILTYIIYL